MDNQTIDTGTQLAAPLPWAMRSVKEGRSTEWFVQTSGGDLALPPKLVCTVYQTTRQAKAIAEHIVRSANSHDAMVAAMQAMIDHCEELREAWQRGALSEHDALGGTRSNRNVDVLVQAREAMELATKEIEE